MTVEIWAIDFGGLLPRSFKLPFDISLPSSLPVYVLVIQIPSCLTRQDPWTVPARLLCPWDSPGKNTGVGYHFLLPGIFPTQGSKPGLLHCRQILYHLSHQGSLHLKMLTFPRKWGSFPSNAYNLFSFLIFKKELGVGMSGLLDIICWTLLGDIYGEFS